MVVFLHFSTATAAITFTFKGQNISALTKIFCKQTFDFDTLHSGRVIKGEGDKTVPTDKNE